jgi:hypothetical protein
MVTPGIVADWEKSNHAKIIPEEALKKSKLAREISASLRSSRSSNLKSRSRGNSMSNFLCFSGGKFFNCPFNF